MATVRNLICITPPIQILEGENSFLPHVWILKVYSMLSFLGTEIQLI